MIYEYWEAPDGSQGSFFPANTRQRELNTNDADGAPMVHVYSVRARTWNQAMRYHHEIQGFSPYKPM